MSEAAAKPSSEADTAPARQEKIEHLLRCLGCGHDLRHLDPNAVCPQCSMPIHRTVRNSRIMYADPAWVSGLYAGCKVMLAGMALMILWAIASGFLANSSSNPRQAADITLVMAAVVVAVLGYGLWRLTAFEPSQTRYPRPWYLLLHGWVRFGALLTGVVAAAGLATLPIAFENVKVQPALAITQFVFLLVLIQLSTLYFARIARRVPDHRLARSIKMYLWTAVVLAVLPALTVAMIFNSTIGRILPPDGVELCTVLSIGITAMLVCWWTLLMVQFLGALHRAAGKANRFAETTAQA